MSSQQTPAPADSPTSPLPACPVCKSSETREADFRGRAGATLYACLQCDVRFFHPVANPGSDWYTDNYAFRNVLEVGRVEWYHRQLFRARQVPRGRLLDVGCGTGSFLAAARSHGFLVSGLDFDAAAVEAARTWFGIDDVYAWSLDDYMRNRPGDRFDIVTAFEVLEHQEDPRAFVESCFALTRPGGYFAISVPFRDRRPNWYEPWDEPPNHLTRWSRRSLVTELSFAGYQVLDVRTGCIASKKFLMDKVRLRMVSGRIETARLAERGPASRGVTLARFLFRTKSALFGGIGRVLDAGLKALGATGIYLYVLAQRPDVDGLAR